MRSGSDFSYSGIGKTPKFNALNLNPNSRSKYSHNYQQDDHRDDAEDAEPAARRPLRSLRVLVRFRQVLYSFLDVVSGLQNVCLDSVYLLRLLVDESGEVVCQLQYFLAGFVDFDAGVALLDGVLHNFVTLRL